METDKGVYCVSVMLDSEEYEVLHVVTDSYDKAVIAAHEYFGEHLEQVASISLAENYVIVNIC